MKIECKRHYAFHEHTEECPDCRAIRVDGLLRDFAEEPDESFEQACERFLAEEATWPGLGLD